jgi:muramoyltetrapeptide carboxypeptidase
MAGERFAYKNIDGVPIQTIRGGKAKGRLIGGNLSVFTAMIGSSYLPAVQSLGDSILFIEEVGEVPYRVDRMLTQLHLAGFFDNGAWIVAPNIVNV